jgi:hypothetical protein
VRPEFLIKRGIMPNVVRLCDFERRTGVFRGQPEPDNDGAAPLSESWQSIIASIEKLESYLEGLRPILVVLPDGPEKSQVAQLMKVIEDKIRDSRMRSIAASVAAAGIEARRVSE